MAHLAGVRGLLIACGLFVFAQPLKAKSPLYVEVAGQGAPVVLIHGGQLDRRMWDDQFQRWAKKYRVVRYDIRGFGKSPSVDEPYSNVEDLAGVLDGQGIRAAHLVGLSLGGGIAIDFALEQPERVLSLTVVAPGLSGFEGWRPETVQGYRAIAEAARDDPNRAVELWLGDPLMKPARENLQLASRVSELARDNIHCWLNNPLMLRPPKIPASKRLDQINVPTLSIVGTRDIPEIHEIIKLIEENVPQNKTVVIDGAGHMVNMEKPAEFNTAVENFLRDLATEPQEVEPLAATGPRLDPPWYQEFLKKHLVYSTAGMDQVAVRRDLEYKRDGDNALRMNVYRPQNAEKLDLRAAVIFVHGGPIPGNLKTNIKDSALYDDYGRALASSGLVGVTFGHRFYAFDRYLNAEQDVADLVAHVREHADELGVDKDRIVVWAFSGGGPLLSQFLRERPAYVRGLVAYYALLDLEPPPSVPVTKELNAALDRLAPLRVISQRDGLPPMLIARAGLDDPAFNATIDRFVDKAVARQAALDFVNHESGHHAFDVEDNNDRSREIIHRTIEFIRTKTDEGSVAK